MSAIKPHAKQTAFLACLARFCLAYCGSQSGKTRAAAPKFAARVARTYNRKLRANAGLPWTRDARGRIQPIANFWVVDPTYALAVMAQRYLAETWEAMGLEVRWEAWSAAAGIYLRAWPAPGCLVQCRSAEKPNALVSEPVDGMWLNEAARIKGVAWSGNLISRVSATNGWAIFDSTPTGENWLYNEVYLPGLKPGHPDYDPARADPDYCVHQWHTVDNPAVDPRVVERAKKTLPEWAYRREFEGDPHNFAGRIFAHWRDAVNVAPIRADDYPELEFGIDFGFGPGHPFVLLVCGLDMPRRRFGIIEEHVHEGMILERQVELFAQIAERHKRARRATGDSADPGMLATMRARRLGRHVDILGASKDVYEGVCAQADMIGDGSYQIHPSCTASIRQHKGYRWKPRNVNDPSAEFHEEPLRQDDDTVAAARYVIYPRLARARRKAA